ncbi:MAG: hypothetical protein J6K20_02280 [Thermoguttaceae bacterium]|nr:hypothetical protein [Thermoguttaceae bacterium]
MKKSWKWFWEKITKYGFNTTCDPIELEWFEKGGEKIKLRLRQLENCETSASAAIVTFTLVAQTRKDWKKFFKVGICATTLINIALEPGVNWKNKLTSAAEFFTPKIVDCFIGKAIEKAGLEEEYQCVCLYLTFLHVLQGRKFKWAREIDQIKSAAFASSVLVRKPTPGVPRIRDRDAFFSGCGESSVSSIANKVKKARLDVALSA